jgi:imidazolonepropionase
MTGLDQAATLSLEGAEGVARPPEDGLEALRGAAFGRFQDEPGSVAVAGGAIAALDADPGAELRIDAGGCWIVPGLVDCHTHLPFAGWRAGEYADKLAGVPYAEIAARGGGIAASARALAQTGDDAVLAQAAGLAAEMLAWGTTTFERKSGYGLSIEGERRQLELGRALDARVAQTTTSTGLLAHAVPLGLTADAWLDEVEAALPGLVADGLVEALDVFVEEIAFGLEHLDRMAALAAAHGLALRCHAEQFTTMRSVPVAIAAGARSVDHLAALHRDDVALLGGADCAAVLLPGAEFLGQEQVAPARALADAGALCVLATDLNPGTSPIAALPVIAGLAARRYGWSAAEALAAMTLNAAWVLGLHGDRGSLETGKRADLLLLDAPVEHLPYRFGHDPVVAVVCGGRLVHARADLAERVR